MGAVGTSVNEVPVGFEADQDRVLGGLAEAGVGAGPLPRPVSVGGNLGRGELQGGLL